MFSIKLQFEPKSWTQTVVVKTAPAALKPNYNRVELVNYLWAPVGADRCWQNTACAGSADTRLYTLRSQIYRGQTSETVDIIDRYEIQNISENKSNKSNRENMHEIDLASQYCKLKLLANWIQKPVLPFKLKFTLRWAPQYQWNSHNIIGRSCVFSE